MGWCRPLCIHLQLVLCVMAVCGYHQVICQETGTCRLMSQRRGVFADCQARFLKGVPRLSNPEEVRAIDLSANHIATIQTHSFVESLNLVAIFLRRNVISVLMPTAFSRLMKLETLDLRQNRIADISSIRNLYFLQFLHLKSNFLTVLNHTSLQDVGYSLSLSLSDNYIPDGLSMLAARVTRLTIVASGLTSLDVQEATFAHLLQHLFASKNKIRAVPKLNNMTALLFLDLSDNPIAIVANDSLPSNLNELNLSGTMLSSLPNRWTHKRLRYLIL